MIQEKCERELEDVLMHEQVVKFLIEKMREHGCEIDRRFFKVENCQSKPVLGGFVPGRGISICYDQITTRTEMENMLAHELIHAYDDCARKKMDWFNVEHHACSEVRAANLSGDCHWVNELFRGNLKVQGQHKICARRRAELSVAMSPQCEKVKAGGGSAEVCARNAVEKVLERCFKDTKPFDDIP